jgi:hypothetical protein
VKSDRPSSGYAALFVELVYDSGGKDSFKFTTEVSVVPDVLPYQWKDAKAKLGPEIRDGYLKFSQSRDSAARVPAGRLKDTAQPKVHSRVLWLVENRPCSSRDRWGRRNHPNGATLPS